MAQNISAILQLIDKFSGPASKIAKSSQNMQQKLESISKTAAAMSAALTGVGVVAVKTAFEYEQAWFNVTKVISGELGTLEKDLQNLSKTTGISFEKIFEAASSAGRLGVAKENIAGFIKNIADVALTSNLTEEMAATSFARMANITKMSQEEFKNLGSAVSYLGDTMATTELEIMDMSLRFASVGKMAGFSQSQILGWSSALSAMGISSEVGGSAMIRTILKVNEIVSAGGLKLNTMAKMSKMTADQFKNAWAKDASGTLRIFLANFEKTAKSVGVSTTELLGAFGIKNVRDIMALAPIIKNIELLDEALAKADKGWESGNYHTEKAAKYYLLLSTEMKKMWQQIRLLTKDFGAALYPAMEKVLPYIKQFLNYLSNLSNDTKATIVITAIAIAIGGIIVAISAFVMAIGWIPIAISAAAVLIGIGIAYIVKYWEDLNDKWYVLWTTTIHKIKAQFNNFVTSVKNIMRDIKQIIPNWLIEMLGSDTTIKVVDQTDSNRLQNTALRNDMSIIRGSYSLDVNVAAEKGSKVTKMSSPDINNGLTFAGGY